MIETDFVEVRQGDYKFYLLNLTAENLALVSYAAVRGVDDEEGAVQRILNNRRISDIRDFVLKVGQFPGSIVLNWVGTEQAPEIKNGKIYVPKIERAAQLIDGQHRVAGIEAAIEERPEIAKLELPVAMYLHLSTKECANIFLSINEEQKPVPKSLVYDLFGIADEQIADSAAVRAADIAQRLNSDDTSPYFSLIKMPGAPRTKGGVALSTVVSTIKPLVENKGELEQLDINGVEFQYKLFWNFFSALRSRVGSAWHENRNAFIYAAGFSAAVEFLRKRVLPFCNAEKDFTKERMLQVLDFDSSDFIDQSEVKGMSGSKAVQHIYSRLDDYFSPEAELGEIKI